jgi:hypothetical protein
MSRADNGGRLKTVNIVVVNEKRHCTLLFIGGFRLPCLPTGQGQRTCQVRIRAAVRTIDYSCIAAERRGFDFGNNGITQSVVSEGITLFAHLTLAVDPTAPEHHGNSMVWCAADK